MKKISLLLIFIVFIGCGGYQIKIVHDEFDKKTIFHMEMWHWVDKHGYIITNYKREKKIHISPIEATFKIAAYSNMTTLLPKAKAIINNNIYEIAITNTEGIQSTTHRSSGRVNDFGHVRVRSSTYNYISYNPKLTFNDNMMNALLNAHRIKIRFSFNEGNITINFTGKELKSIRNLARYRAN